MRAIDTDAIAIRGGTVTEDDATESHARRSGEMTRLAAVVVDGCPHRPPPRMQRLCDDHEIYLWTLGLHEENERSCACEGSEQPGVRVITA
jgi:hypothetical protein